VNGGELRWLVLPVVALSAAMPAPAAVYLSIEQAQQLMFGSTPLAALSITLTPAQIAAIEQRSGVPVHSPTLQVWKAPNGFFLVDAVIGKHDLITYAVALSAQGVVRGVEVLEYREAYGSEIRLPRWRAQFTGKHPGDALRVGQDIQGISGATLSCAHVTEGIRRLLVTYDVALRDA
jgi:hypothetical protein